MVPMGNAGTLSGPQGHHTSASQYGSQPGGVNISRLTLELTYSDLLE